jgi:hypothetical protein
MMLADNGPAFNLAQKFFDRRAFQRSNSALAGYAFLVC